MEVRLAVWHELVVWHAVLVQAEAAAARQLVAQKRAAEVMTKPHLAEQKRRKAKKIKKIQKLEAAARQQVAQQRAAQGMTKPLS